MQPIFVCIVYSVVLWQVPVWWMAPMSSSCGPFSLNSSRGKTGTGSVLFLAGTLDTNQYCCLPPSSFLNYLCVSYYLFPSDQIVDFLFLICLFKNEHYPGTPVTFLPQTISVAPLPLTLCLPTIHYGNHHYCINLFISATKHTWNTPPSSQQCGTSRTT